ncbi:MAG: CatA-like O-acetyltransferase [Bacillota bacterium]|nr:CatA-like O-acetyltransferase [Bacillota bacterium]
MVKIDYESWERRELFEFFSAVSQPFYSVTYNLDVTKLYDYTHSRGLSFYYALSYLVTKAVNSVENFRYAIENGEIVKHEELLCSFTDLKKGSDNFHIVTMPCNGTIDEFCAAAAKKSSAQKEFIDMSLEGKNLIFISCLPWIELTALTNERNFDPDDNIPRIAWGKFHEENGRRVLGISLELNHRFCDGVHIGKFSAELEKLISEL